MGKYEHMFIYWYLARLTCLTHNSRNGGCWTDRMVPIERTTLSDILVGTYIPIRMF